MQRSTGMRLGKAAAIASVFLLSISPADAGPKMAKGNTSCIERFSHFVFAPAPSAFALSGIVPKGERQRWQVCGSSWDASSQRQAREQAVARCRLAAKELAPQAAASCQVVNLKYVIKMPPQPRQQKRQKVKTNWR